MTAKQSGTQHRPEHVVSRTYVREDRHLAPVERSELHLRRRLGIIGDCHAGSNTPRQVLIAATGVYTRLNLSANVLRENLLLEVESVAWASGTQIRIGPRVTLRVMFHCESCARLNAHRAGLMRELGIDRGTVVRVIRGGVVRVGDRITTYAGIYEPLPHDWQARLCMIVARLPKGSWVPYLRLAELNGVHASYCRVFPRVLGFSKYGRADKPTRGVKRTSRGLEPVTHPMDSVPWTGESVFAD